MINYSKSDLIFFSFALIFPSINSFTTLIRQQICFLNFLKLQFPRKEGKHPQVSWHLVQQLHLNPCKRLSPSSACCCNTVSADSFDPQPAEPLNETSIKDLQHNSNASSIEAATCVRQPRIALNQSVDENFTPFDHPCTTLGQPTKTLPLPKPTKGTTSNGEEFIQLCRTVPSTSWIVSLLGGKSFSTSWMLLLSIQEEEQQEQQWW